jgi:hypothetical protein
MNSVNKDAESLTNTEILQSSGKGHREVWYTANSVSEEPATSTLINETTGSHTHYLISTNLIHIYVKFPPNLVKKDDLKTRRVEEVSLHEFLLSAVDGVDCNFPRKELQISMG